MTEFIWKENVREVLPPDHGQLYTAEPLWYCTNAPPGLFPQVDRDRWDTAQVKFQNPFRWFTTGHRKMSVNGFATAQQAMQHCNRWLLALLGVPAEGKLSAHKPGHQTVFQIGQWPILTAEQADAGVKLFIVWFQRHSHDVAGIQVVVAETSVRFALLAALANAGVSTEILPYCWNVNELSAEQYAALGIEKPTAPTVPTEKENPDA